MSFQSNTSSNSGNPFDLLKIKANKRWEQLSEPQQNLLKKFWQVLTYKWQWQIVLNSPFLVWWILDKQIETVHNFDTRIIESLNLPSWLSSLMGLG